jgi:hypothetical protein
LALFRPFYSSRNVASKEQGQELAMIARSI